MRRMLYAGGVQLFFGDERPSFGISLHVQKLLDFVLILYVIDAAMFHHRLLRRLTAKLSSTSPCSAMARWLSREHALMARL